MRTPTVVNNLLSAFPEKDETMPVLFVGHGSPMNAIMDNEFSNYWSLLAKEIPTPVAVLCISAHWLTKGTHITAMPAPRTIHDFSGFPSALFEVEYPAPGNPLLAEATKSIIRKAQIELDHERGLDHGTWSVVKHMYPNADIPVLQLSIDYHQPAVYHYALAKELSSLRKRGVLIMGSGNMVHNLRLINFEKINDSAAFGYDWANEMNDLFKTHIGAGNHQPLLHYESLGEAARLAIPTPDHYYPLIYTLGLQDKNDEVSFFNDKAVAGSITMTSVRFSPNL
jgi:4,5-DOPA dioxygenase extradiol